MPEHTINVNDRVLSTLSRLRGPDDHDRNRYDLDFDETYAYRILLGGYALLALLGARNAREDLAISYRDFKVGAAAVAFNTQANRIDIVTGFNAKVDGTDLVNNHAEDIVMEKIRRMGANIVSLLMVVADIQPDQTSNLETATLHPCGRCRKMLKESGLISPDTIMMSARPDLSIVEVYDLENLIRLHNGQPAHINTVRLTVPNPSAPEDLAWCEDWDDKVVRDLLVAKCAALDERQF